MSIFLAAEGILLPMRNAEVDQITTMIFLISLITVVVGTFIGGPISTWLDIKAVTVPIVYLTIAGGVGMVGVVIFTSIRDDLPQDETIAELLSERYSLDISPEMVENANLTEFVESENVEYALIQDLATTLERNPETGKYDPSGEEYFFIVDGRVIEIATKSGTGYQPLP